MSKKRIHPLVATLLSDIERYCVAYGISLTTFGLKSTNNPNLVGRMRNGRTPNLETIDKVRAYIGRSTKAVKQK